MLAPSLWHIYPGKLGTDIPGESEKAEGRLQRPPIIGSQHPEAEALIWDRKVFHAEWRGENGSRCLSVCGVLPPLLLAQRVSIIQSRGKTSGSVWSSRLDVECAG